MLFSSRTFLAGATVVTSLVSFSFAKNVDVKFDKCVTECVAGAGCAWNDVQCMCTSAQDALLDLVAACMYYHCQPELRQFDATFLDVLVDGCKEFGKAIPKEDVKAARDSADMFLQKLQPQPTKTMVTKPAPVSSTGKAVVVVTSVVEESEGLKTTLASVTRTTSEEMAEPTETESERSSSVEDLPTAITTPVVDEATQTAQETTLDLATGSPTALGGFGAATTTRRAPSTEATDSSPFATVEDSGASIRGVTSWAWAGFPLVAAWLVR